MNTKKYKNHKNFKNFKDRTSLAERKFHWAQNSLYRVQRSLSKFEEENLAYMIHEIDQYRGWFENHYMMDKVSKLEEYASALLAKYQPQQKRA